MRRYALLVTAAVAMTGCVSAGSTDNLTDAVLDNAEESAVRQAIRIYVRNQAGRGVIARPDSLSTDSTLELVPRLRTQERPAADTLRAVPDFRLMRDPIGGCWLMRVAKDGSAPDYERLPDSTRCSVATDDDG